MGTGVAHGLFREVEAGAAGWGVIAGAGVVWVGVGGLVGMGGGGRDGGVVGGGDGIDADGPEVLGVHVAEEFLVDRDEVGADGVIGFAQLGRAVLLVMADDQVAVEPTAGLVGFGTGVGGVLAGGRRGCGRRVSNHETGLVRKIQARIAAGNALVGRHGHRIDVGVVDGYDIQGREVNGKDVIGTDLFVQLESRRGFAHGVGIVLVLLGQGLRIAVEVGHVNAHAPKPEIVGVILVEPHAFRHVVVLPDLVLRMIPIPATRVPHVSVPTHLIVVRPRDCNIVDADRVVVIHFYQDVFGLLRGILGFRVLMFDLNIGLSSIGYVVLFVGSISPDAMPIIPPQRNVWLMTSRVVVAFVGKRTASAYFHFCVDFACIDLICIELLDHWYTGHSEKEANDSSNCCCHTD